MIRPVIPNRGYYTFHYRYAKHNREGRRKRTNKQTWTWVTSKCKKGESIWYFSCSFPCICRLSRACILRETSKKPRGILTHHWLCFLSASFCWPSFPWTPISSRPSFSASLRCQLALSVYSGTFLPSSTSGLAGDLVLGPLHQSSQIVRLTGANINGNELLRIVS